jgi:hypothetical protein
MMNGTPMLKAKKEVVFRVNYGDLDEFIREAYGLEYKAHEGGYGGQYPYDFAASEESANDSSHSFSVEPEAPDKYEAQQIAEMKSGKFQTFITSALLSDLCHRGLIEPGEYIIDVCW